MPVQKCVKSLESLCVKAVVDNLDKNATQWSRQVVDSFNADLSNQQIISAFDVIRKYKMFP